MLYVAPSEAQDYAASLGAEPGTPEYETLMSDYVLRHSGPTATANAMLEEDNRQTNRIGLEGVSVVDGMLPERGLPWLRVGVDGKHHLAAHAVRQSNRSPEIMAGSGACEWPQLSQTSPSPWA